MGTFGPGDTLTFLTSAPPDGIATKKTTHNPAVPASDGSFWTACTPDPCVRVTRDHGATWQPMSTVDGVTAVDWVATTDGRSVFAAARQPAGPRLLRSVPVPGSASACPGAARRSAGLERHAVG